MLLSHAHSALIYWLIFDRINYHIVYVSLFSYKRLIALYTRVICRVVVYYYLPRTHKKQLSGGIL